MQPLAVLPVFLDLNGRRVVVAGGGPAAAWKAELAAAAGATVEVFADAHCDELVDLRAALPQGRLALIDRPWQPDDLDGAVIAIGALEGDEAAAFAGAAEAAGVPVNVVDTPTRSTFSFGTIVNRAPVTIGISTGGVAPVLGQAIRARIETMLHPALGAWGAAARRLRDKVKTKLALGHARREFWRRFAEAALSTERAPSEDEIADILGDAPTEGGSVALVGAGPGDPQLLTLRAMRILQSADVILYDRLVSSEVLQLARREAARILVGKTGGGVHCRQDDINALMVKLAIDGQRVVRLKGGDPMIFGRAGEEIAACRAAGIPVEVVPGVTAALGAAAELLVPLTDRKVSKRVQFVTGHSVSGRAPEHDWPSLADPWTTTVFYMGARTFAEMLPKLLAAGLDPETPAIAASAVTTSRAKHVACTAAALPQYLTQMDGDEPCLIILGRAALQPVGPDVKHETVTALGA